LEGRQKEKKMGEGRGEEKKEESDNGKVWMLRRKYGYVSQNKEESRG
jgi:hypothetical protein